MRGGGDLRLRRLRPTGQQHGQYRDADSGRYYLRARYYDPATQQFLTVDPLLAATEQAYAYAGGSPLNATDPSGLHCGQLNDDDEGGCASDYGLGGEGWIPPWKASSGGTGSAPSGINLPPGTYAYGGSGSGSPRPSNPASAVTVGEFCISDWSGYPGDKYGIARPTGPFKLIGNPEYAMARMAADSANNAIRRDARAIDPLLLRGQEIHEIHPVKFGGSPTDPGNKIALPKPIHYEFSAWWLRLQGLLDR